MTSATERPPDLRDGLLRENDGWIARSHFMEACNALWLAGELVHVEDLVLHDARMDIRTPTHELTRAHAILRTRRQIAASPPAWAFSPKGIASLRGRAATDALIIQLKAQPAVELETSIDQEIKSDAENEFEGELARLDALLDRSARLLAQPSVKHETFKKGRGGENLQLRPRLLRTVTRWSTIPEWNEDKRMERWFAVHDQARDLPPLLAAAVVWDAWEDIEPLQHQHWLGPMLVSAMLRERGKTRSHLAAFNAGLRTIPRDRRRARDRTTRLIAFLEAVQVSSVANLKEVERLSLARMQMERKLKDRRSTSSLAGHDRSHFVDGPWYRQR